MVVIDPSGLHARPAAKFVQTASRFESRIVLHQDGREADAKSLISLLGLTIRPSSVITLTADGPDADGWWAKDGQVLNVDFIYLTFMAPIGPVLTQQLINAGFNATSKIDDAWDATAGNAWSNAVGPHVHALP